MKKSKKQKVLAVLLAAALAASALPMTAVTAFASDDEEPLVVCTESFMNESPHFVSDDIYVYAWAYGGNSGDDDSNGYVYRFDYRSADADEWTVIADYSSEQSVSFQIDTAGSYVLRLSAMDLDGVVAYEDIDLNIYAIPVNTSTISAANITNYEPVTITPSFDGDMGDNEIYGYTVSWEYPGTDESDVGSDFIYGNEPTTIAPAYTGTYEITVDLELYYGETETAVFNEAQITQFAYYYRRSGSTKWITADDYSENSSIDITPTQAGTYEVCVKLKDENNSVTKAYLTFTVEESEPLYVVLEATDQSVFTGNTVTFYADAAGGAYGEFTYAFYYKKTDSTKWLTLAGFGYDNSVSFTPAEAGTYDICVKAKDSTTTVKSYLTLTVE